MCPVGCPPTDGPSAPVHYGSGGRHMSRNTRTRGARRRLHVALTTAATLTAAAAIAGPAHANFSAVSPVLLVSGHPFSYTDPTGLSLELCINDPGCPASPPVLENQAPNDEAFYQLASSTATDGSKEATIDFHLEAAFLAGPITFGRIQATFHGLERNEEYTGTHPYGVSHFTTDENGELIGRAPPGQGGEIGARRTSSPPRSTPRSGPSCGGRATPPPRATRATASRRIPSSAPRRARTRSGCPARACRRSRPTPSRAR